MPESTASSLPAMSLPPTEPPPPRTASPLLVAHAVALGWNLLLFAGWMVWIIITTRQDPDWGDLVLVVGTMLGVGALAVSASLAAIAVAVASRRGRWRERVIGTPRAVWYGSVAAMIGFAPIGLVLLVSGISA